MHKRFFAAVLAAVGSTLSLAASATAGGPPVVIETTHPVDVTFSFPADDPCNGASTMVTGTGSGVSHFVLFADGRGQFTDTLNGTIVAYLVDAQGNPTSTVDSTGSFTSWDGGSGFFDESGNPIGKSVFTDTFDTRQTTSSGQMFTAHVNGQTLTNPLGLIKLAFLNVHEHCA